MCMLFVPQSKHIKNKQENALYCLKVFYCEEKYKNAFDMYLRRKYLLVIFNTVYDFIWNVCKSVSG